MISLKKMFYIALILFPLGTLITSVSIIGMIVNKLLMIFIILGLIGFLDRGTRKTYIMVFLVAALFILDLFFTNFPLIHSNEIYYLFIWVVFLNVFCDKIDIWFKDLCNMETVMKLVIVIWNILVIISLFSSKCYDETGAFISLTGGMHRFDSSALLIITFILFLYKKNKNKKIFFWMVVPYIGILLSGARTYICVAAALLVLILYGIIRKKIYFWIFIIPIGILGVYLILNTTVMKNRLEFSNFVLEKYGYLGAITSGRSIFWKIDLQEFSKSPVAHKLFGNGFNFIRETNGRYYGKQIWAHNDYINIIGCNGYMGLLLYLISYFRIMKIGKKYFNQKKLLIFILINFVFIFNAMFNMLYTYQSAVFSIPFILYFFYNSSNERKEKNEII